MKSPKKQSHSVASGGGLQLYEFNDYMMTRNMGLSQSVLVSAIMAL